MAAVYPLSFRPVFKSYPWGGRALAERLGRTIPEGIVAESWEISAHAAGPTPVAGGALAGLTLAEVQARLGVELLGGNNRGAARSGTFPLLVKLLDANQWLSVQVHPADDYARAHHDDLGKSEMWVVLAAAPGAEIILGFAAPENRASVARAIAEGRLPELLHRLPASAGDVFLVPPGSIHALGPGLLIAEIQQSSNVTYRLYDWDRSDAGRELHIERGLDVLDYDLVRPRALPVPADGEGPRRPLCQTAHFASELVLLGPGETLNGRCAGETFEIWGLLEGRGTLQWNGAPLTLDAVEWLLLPAALGAYAVRSEEASRWLKVTTPAPAASPAGGA